MDPWTKEGIARREALNNNANNNNSNNGNGDSDAANKQTNTEENKPIIAISAPVSEGKTEEPDDNNNTTTTSNNINNNTAATDNTTSNNITGEETTHPPEYYDYELVGIVVHMGSADSGHYYSYIRERVPLKQRRPGDPVPWYEFNDTRVIPFDPADIPHNAFGGMEEVMDVDRNTGRQMLVKRLKSYNAYILVYERKHPLPVNNNNNVTMSVTTSNTNSNITINNNTTNNTTTPVSPSTSENAENKEVNIINNNKQEGNPIASSSSGSTPPSSTSVSVYGSQKPRSPFVPLPELLRKEIWKENSKFYVEKYVMNYEYFSFIWELLNLTVSSNRSMIVNPIIVVEPAAKPTTTTTTDLGEKAEEEDNNTTSTTTTNNNNTGIIFNNAVMCAWRFVWEVYSHFKDKNLLGIWVLHLKRMCRASPQACADILTSIVTDPALFKGVLGSCPIERIRVHFADVLGVIFEVLAPQSRAELKAWTATFVHKKPDISSENNNTNNNNNTATTTRSNNNNNNNDEENKTNGEEVKPVTSQPATTTTTTTTTTSSAIPVSPLIKFIEFLITPSMLFWVRKAKFAAEYFQLFCHFVKQGNDELIYCAQRGLVGLLIEVAMGSGEFVPPSWFKFFTLAGLGLKDPEANSTALFLGPVRVGAQQCGPLLDFILHIVKTNTFSKEPSPVYQNVLGEQVVKLQEVEIAAILDKEFLTRMLREDVNLPSLAALVTHLSWENKENSNAICSVILEGLSRLGMDARAFYKAMRHVTSLNDSLNEWRVDVMMVGFFKIVGKNSERKESIEISLEFVEKVLQKEAAISKWLNENIERLMELMDNIGFDMTTTKKSTLHFQIKN